MENKTYSNFLHTVNTEKWNDLKQKSIRYSTMLEYLDRSEPKEKIIKDLQVLCFEINNTLRKTIDYLQLKENLNILNSTKEKIYIYSKDLNETLHKCINELKTFGTTELVDYDKLYFDYLELTPKTNKETSIYAYEIEKEFKEFIKIKAVEQKEHEEKNHTKRNEIDKEIFDLTLQFATGQLDSYFKINKDKTTYTNYKLSAPKIAKEIKKNRLEKYILCTINYHDNIKNLWKSKKYLNAVYEYSMKNDNITLTDFFKEKHNQINQD